MRIQHNIAALNAHRQLGVNNMGSSKALEKLSSGYRINRAADDAAGLAISEKMRGQIRGLTQATRNAQDGISLIQTAEGGLQESHAILQRMRELAVQSATGTNTPDDRAELQREVDQLVEELTRIAENTEFNTMRLLDGDFATSFHIGANINQNMDVSIGNMTAKALAVGDVETAAGTLATGKFNSGDVGTYRVAVEGEGENKEYFLLNAKGDKVATGTVGEDDNEIVYQFIDENGDNIADKTLTLTVGEGEGNVPAHALDYGTVKIAPGVTGDLEATWQAGISIRTDEDANNAIDTIQNALNIVSTARSELGAVQNRLEHTVANLGVTAENLTDAESRIRDVDMAAEMLEFTKFNILNQASIAMLAQANMQPQSVLQLLA